MFRAKSTQEKIINETNSCHAAQVGLISKQSWDQKTLLIFQFTIVGIDQLYKISKERSLGLCQMFNRDENNIKYSIIFVTHLSSCNYVASF